MPALQNPVTQSLLTALEKSAPLSAADRHFLSLYYHRLSGQDYRPQLARMFHRIACRHRELGTIRAPGQCIVALDNQIMPGGRAAGAADCTHIFIVQDDRAFIIDSLLIKLDALGKTPHRMLHPLFAVTRDQRRKAVRYAPAGGIAEGDGSALESYTYFLVDRIPECKHAAVAAEIHQVLDLSLIHI